MVVARKLTARNALWFLAATVLGSLAQDSVKNLWICRWLLVVDHLIDSESTTVVDDLLVALRYLGRRKKLDMIGHGLCRRLEVILDSLLKCSAGALRCGITLLAKVVDRRKIMA